MHSILMGDDSAAVRSSLREFLQQQGNLEVIGDATNGQETIARALELNPDIVILDVAMPVMNGLEAARELKRLRPGMPIVLFTTYHSSDLINLALSSGADAVVPKDQPALLVEEIQSLLKTSA